MASRISKSPSPSKVRSNMGGAWVLQSKQVHRLLRAMASGWPGIEMQISKLDLFCPQPVGKLKPCSALVPAAVENGWLADWICTSKFGSRRFPFGRLKAVT
jgi:hypothetical protein